MITDIDLLIFDLDGTLVDTREDLANAVNHALRHLGIATLPTDDVMNFVGNGLKKLMERSLGTQLQEKLPQAIALFQDYYRDHLIDNSVLYPGVREVLEHYRNKKKAVISNKPEAFTIAMIEQLNLSPHFQLILGGDTVAEMKPSPVPVQHVLGELGVPPRRGVMVGDGTTDIESGRAAGIQTCAVTYGYRSSEVLSAVEPDHLLSGITDLLRYYK